MGGKMKKIAIASAIYFTFSAAYSADGSSCSNFKGGKFFATDRNANSPNKWYFIGKSGNGWNLSSSWKGAKELKRYADANANIKYKGIALWFYN